MMKSRNMLGIVAILGAAAFSGWAGAAEAGRVVTVVGRVTAATPDGQIRTLASGATVENGEMLITGANSFLRVRFVDDAYVILRPNTRFQIEGYQLSERAEENLSVFRLLKGGFRTVTGLIGQRNQRGYSVRTSLATIGVRGTEFQLMHCDKDDCGPNMPDGDYLGVDRGTVEMTTAGGQQSFNAGEYAYVNRPTVPPAAVAAEQAGLLHTDPCPGATCEQ
ncbi:MAG: FecR domain-containing protein [Gammaproteobacteria bacterium]|nr:FecR domain-containing protein [Gammaproteobacteria bacterium]